MSLVPPTDLRPPRSLPARSPSMPRVVAVWHRWCSGRRRARPPARSPHASFARSGRSRSPARPRRRPPAPRQVPPAPSTPATTCVLVCVLVRRLEARPDLAFAPQASSPALAHIAAESTPNVARNSPATLSNIEFRSLELQRFLTLLELYPIELRATFLGSCPTVGDVAGGSFLVFCWFLLVRNVARLLLWSCVWLVFGEDLGLLVERNVALVWVCGVCCERKFAPAW